MDLSKYSIDAIHELMRKNEISGRDVQRYIRDYASKLEMTPEVIQFIQEANDYLDDKLASGINLDEEHERMLIEDGYKIVEQPENLDNDGSTTSQEESESLSTTTEKAESATETIEEQQPEPEELEAPEPLPINDELEEFIEEGYAEEGISNDINIDNSFKYDSNKGKSSLDEAFWETKNFCDDPIHGIKMEGSPSGKDGRGPYITFEINNESRQFIDNLMSTFYQNQSGVSVEFMRNFQNRSEYFTISLDPNLSKEEMEARATAMFNQIYNTMNSTRDDFNYEQTMPEGLKVIKDRFSNDDPDINLGNEVTIGYVSNDGKDSYYIIANNSAAAVEYARSIGYDIKNSQGANVFELRLNGNPIETKLDEASVDLSNQRLNVKDNGVSDLDIYGKLDTDAEVEKIQNFIETSNDPHLMCILQVEIPQNNPTQRIVAMKSEMGGTEIVVFPDGDSFDKNVMPKIIDTYTDNNAIYQENISKSGSDTIDRASYMVESENNTTLSVNGYSESEVDKMIAEIKSKSNEASADYSNVNTNSRQKTIGTYPTSDQNKHAFVSMPVLFVICILFILMISLIIFAN